MCFWILYLTSVICILGCWSKRVGVRINSLRGCLKGRCGSHFYFKLRTNTARRAQISLLLLEAEVEFLFCWEDPP